MAQRGDLQINNFVKGLVTEASPLTFPDNASIDEINFKLKRDGTRERRLGLNFEEDYQLNSTGLSADVLAAARLCAYRWEAPNGQAEVDIGVIQVGNSLYFIDLLTDNPSANLLNGGSPITAVGTSNDQLMAFATINGYLIGVSNALDNPYLFSYDKDTDIVSHETAQIMVRDLWGVDDGLGVNERPTVLTDEHKYNLRNQGWDENIISTCGTDAIDCTFATFGVYPSNSDPWTIGRIEDLTSANAYKYDPAQAERNLIATGQSARGHFIIPLFYRGTSRASQTGLTLDSDRELSRFRTIASYAGRVFYAGILSRVVNGDNRSPSLSGTVFFSQLFVNKIDLVKCYQEADPTSPDINDIIDTDGGYIQIPGCIYIYELRPIKQSLFVFGVNGVWEIRGGENGFTATSYQVNKISNIGVYAPKSIVEVNGVIIFWATSGIYSISPNEFGTFDTQNITLPTIQRYFNSIPDSYKRNARGHFDNHTNTARWLFYSSEAKEVGEVIDYEPPLPVVEGVITSPIAIVSTIGIIPELAKVNDNTVLVIYTKAGGELSTVLYYRLISYTADFTGTVQTEGTLIASTGSSLSGYAIKQLYDNKVLLVFRKQTDTFGAVITYSGGSISVGGLVTLNNTFSPVLTTSSLQIDRISNTKVVVGNRNTDNAKPSCQVVDIDGSDTITFGSVAKSTTLNTTNPSICMLTSTKGVMLWNNSINMAGEVFTISGSTITFHGTAYGFPTASHTTGHNTYGCNNADIIRIDSNRFGVYGVGYSALTGQSTVNHPSGFVVTESSGVLTSTSIWKNTEYATSTALTTAYPAVVGGDNGRVFTLHTSNDTLTNKMWFTNWENSDPPELRYDIEVLSWSGLQSDFNEEIVHMGGGYYVMVYQQSSVNAGIYTLAIKGY